MGGGNAKNSGMFYLLMNRSIIKAGAWYSNKYMPLLYINKKEGDKSQGIWF